MLVHVAAFKWKSGTKDAEVDKALSQIRSIVEFVPDIVSIYCGSNFSKWAEGFTHAVVVIANNQAALDAYRTHPVHVEAAKVIDEMEEKGVGIDFFDPLPIKES